MNLLKTSKGLKEHKNFREADLVVYSPTNAGTGVQNTVLVQRSLVYMKRAFWRAHFLSH